MQEINYNPGDEKPILHLAKLMCASVVSIFGNDIVAYSCPGGRYTVYYDKEIGFTLRDPNTGAILHCFSTVPNEGQIWERIEKAFKKVTHTKSVESGIKACTEFMGDLPPLQIVRNFADEHGGFRAVYLN